MYLTKLQVRLLVVGYLASLGANIKWRVVHARADGRIRGKKIKKKNSLFHVYDMSEKLCSYLSFDVAYGEDWEWISEFVDDKNQARAFG